MSCIHYMHMFSSYLKVMCTALGDSFPVSKLTSVGVISQFTGVMSHLSCLNPNLWWLYSFYLTIFFRTKLPPNSNPPTPSPSRGADHCDYLQVGQLRADLPDPLASVPDRLEGTRGTGPGLLDGLRQGKGAGMRLQVEHGRNASKCDLGWAVGHVYCVVIKCFYACNLDMNIIEKSCAGI